jgi:putative ABC transport system substrate-binding protein
MHDLVPTAIRVALLVNPSNARNAETPLRVVLRAAHAIGVQIAVLKASTEREIEAAFAALKSERIDALFVSNDGESGLRLAAGMVVCPTPGTNPASVIRPNSAASSRLGR